MSLRKSPEPTAAFTAAIRSNSKHSTGPRTAAGKAASSQNAGKHWGRAEVFREFMPALGERAADFEELRRGFFASHVPRDEFERQIVNDMAELHWRSRRLLRGEAAAQAARRRHLQEEVDADEAQMDCGKLSDVDLAISQALGYVGLNDSPAKFQHIINYLVPVRQAVAQSGFQAGGLETLRTVYGKNPGWRRLELIALYQTGMEAEKAGEAAKLELIRQEFARRLAAELAWFEERAAKNRQARLELKAAQVDSALVTGQTQAEHRDLANLMACQERLENRFKAKWELLKDYRRARRAEAAIDAKVLTPESGDDDRGTVNEAENKGNVNEGNKNKAGDNKDNGAQPS